MPPGVRRGANSVTGPSPPRLFAITKWGVRSGAKNSPATVRFAGSVCVRSAAKIFVPNIFKLPRGPGGNGTVWGFAFGGDCFRIHDFGLEENFYREEVRNCQSPPSEES